METPKTNAGRVTEAVMANITRKVGKMPTHNYNAIYSAVLEALQKEMPEPGVLLALAGAEDTRIPRPSKHD